MRLTYCCISAAVLFWDEHASSASHGLLSESVGRLFEGVTVGNQND